MKKITIGDTSRESGVKVPTIRYYESIGLLAAPSRSEGNQRSYEPADLRRLVFIRHARELGFEVDAIRTLLTSTAEDLGPAGYDLLHGFGVVNGPALVGRLCPRVATERRRAVPGPDRSWRDPARAAGGSGRSGKVRSAKSRGRSFLFRFRLAAVHCLAYEAAYPSLLSPELAAGIRRVQA